MPSLKDTKRRIASVKNTQKITRAMKLVSSAKYVRAQRLLVDSKPYRLSLMRDLALAVSQDIEGALTYTQENNQASKDLIIVLGTDRGLCGGLNANLLKKLEAYLRNGKDRQVDLRLWGRKMVYSTYGKRPNCQEKREREFDKPDYAHVRKVVEPLLALWRKGEYRSISFAYSEFKNAMTQVASIQTVLPLRISDEVSAAGANLVFEPNPSSMLASLVGKYISSLVYSLVCEGSLSEHAARMTAMDNATTNADQVIRSLTLDYNRARQAFITKELIEITSGAEAL